MIWLILIGLFIALTLYCCVVIAGRAEKKEQEMWEKENEQCNNSDIMDNGNSVHMCNNYNDHCYGRLSDDRGV